MDQLATAPEHHIRAILLSLCADKDVKKKALERYSALIAHDQPTNALKRKASGEIFICAQCNSPFSKEDNEKGSCIYHTGKYLSYHS